MIFAVLIFTVLVILFFATTIMDSNKNAAKYAFFYMLSLVALIFTSVSVGMILFQIINKTIADPLTLGIYQPGRFSSGALRFAISALIISAPIFYLAITQIFKSMRSGLLEKESGIRKWLTYFILFVSVVVMLGWLIATLNNFLNGELTAKFILKALSSIIISALIFSFYFYDIRRKDIKEKKDNIIRIYFYGSIVLVSAALIASFFFIESPSKVRAQKHDRQVVLNLSQINDAVNSYFDKTKTVPEKLDQLFEDQTGRIYITQEIVKDPQTGQAFDYKKTEKDTYEVCANFNLSTKDANDGEDYDKFLDERWTHEAGYQCFTKKAEGFGNPDPLSKVDAQRN